MKKGLVIAGILIVVAVAAIIYSFASQGEVTGKVVEKVENNKILSCVDSDGKDAWNVKGNVNLRYDDGKDVKYEDYCDESSVVDYYCEGNSMLKAVYAGCPCSDGKCEGSKDECTENNCNPSNTREICLSGLWASCPQNQVCSSGKCTTPRTIVGVSRSGGGGGGSSSTASTESPASVDTSPTYTTTSLGDLQGEVYSDMAKYDRLEFTVGGNAGSITATEVTPTGVALILNTGETVSLSVGQTRNGDITSDGVNDISLRLKSTNIFTNKARILLGSL